MSPRRILAAGAAVIALAFLGIASTAFGPPLLLMQLSGAGTSQVPSDPPRLLDEDAPHLLLRDVPLELRFSEPLVGIDAESPDVVVHARVSARDAHVALIEATSLEPGQSVSIRLSGITGLNGTRSDDRIVEARTPDGVELSSIASTTPTNRIAVFPEVPVSLDWTSPVHLVSYRVDGERFRWTGDPSTHILLDLSLPAGATRRLAIDDAITEEGGWLDAETIVELHAAAPLRIAAHWPEFGETVDPHSAPVFRFTEAVADREAAERAIRFDPPLEGRFEWPTPDRVKFVPNDLLPPDSEIVVRVLPGPSGARSESGSYLEEEMASAFSTGPNKLIHVSLGSQRLTLFENDEPVWSTLVATGVRGADTPTGSYQVLAKLPTTRFRGVNVDGSRYDIPNVHWVLPFQGDYTIHGAYWRSTFGRVGSNGCVSMSDPNAKIVFDWASVGTPVLIER